MNITDSRQHTSWVFTFCVVAAIALGLSAASAEAALVLASVDARAEYPLAAPVLTSPLTNGEAAAPYFDANSRGVRNNRIQAQTFQVTEPISLESIFVGYRWNSADNLPTTFRLLQIPDVGTIYDPTTAPVLAGPLPVTVGAEPASNHPGDYYAMRFDWTGSPLILSPQPGQAGYALEFVGSASSGPIAILFRDNVNTYPLGRAMEQFNNVAQGVQDGDDWVIAITGSVVPEPSTLALLASVGTIICSFMRRRR